jgi:bifunctional non-homologous end joining protein LigD
VHDADGTLRSAGSVGTGWDIKTAQELRRKLDKLAVQTSPFGEAKAKKGRWSRRTPGAEHWVKPVMVVEVRFSEWTPDGQVRHAAFIAERTDKAPQAITVEKAKPVMGAGLVRASRGNRTTAAGDIKVSNPDRVIDASTGTKKIDLVRYYESVATWMLPHLKGRPVSLVRGPTGVSGELFFQKHGEKIGIPGITELDAKLWPGHSALLQIDTAKAIAGSAQMNVIEFHTWNSASKAIDKPDRMIFDLDPGENTTWAHVQEAATLTRAMLKELGLESWLKTSGGKGLHVVVPLAPRYGYDDVKAFSGAVVAHMARVIPTRFVAKSGASNRVGKIFIDYLRNGHGATTATAFSARARPGLGVSMPVAWEDLPGLKGGAQWTVATAREYLSFQTSDPWAAYWKARQPLGAAMKALGFKPKREA